MNRARIDAEGACGNVGVGFGLGVHQEGESAGVADEHTLASFEYGDCIDAYAMAQSRRFDGGHFGGLEFHGSLRELEFGYDLLEVCRAFGKNDHGVAASFQDSGSQNGPVQGFAFKGERVHLSQDVFPPE